MNLYKWPTPNPAPKPTRHWGLDKSYKIVWVRLYEFIRINHRVKYVRIGCEIALDWHNVRSYLFFNVQKLRTKISDSVCNGLYISLLL